MAQLLWWVLRHRVHGAAATFDSRAEAEQALQRVLRDEPTWAPELSVELFDLAAVEAVPEAVPRLAD